MAGSLPVSDPAALTGFGTQVRCVVGRHYSLYAKARIYDAHRQGSGTSSSCQTCRAGPSGPAKFLAVRPHSIEDVTGELGGFD